MTRMYSYTRLRFLAAALVALPLLAFAAGQAPASDNAVLKWNAVATQAFLPTEGTDPLSQSRTYAMMHAAMHDALNAIERRYASYTPGLPSVPGASPEAAIAAAAHDVLAALVPAQLPLIQEAYERALAPIPAGPAEAGASLGQAAAALIINRRHDDGVAAAFAKAYAPTGLPGDYTYTPPFDAPPLGPLAVAPGWGDVTPFAIDLEAHRLPGPLPLTSAAYARELEQVRTIGSADSTTRSADQSEIARFWYEDSPIGWNRIASSVMRQKAVGLWESARILALMNFAAADGYIAGFAEKYEKRFWRPVTAIRQAGLDGNRFTVSDQQWTPYLITPPVPDYPSTHTVVGAAAARVLVDAFGDRVRFSTTSATESGVTRRFGAFTEAARENGLSRVYAGIHFMRAVDHGYRQGWRIGQKTARLLPPVR